MPQSWDRYDESEQVAELERRMDRHISALVSSFVPMPAKDSFTVTSNGVSPTLQLSALPYNGTLGSSVYLKWNGAPQHEGDDYTVDYTTGVVTLAASIVSKLKATPAPADLIFVEYWTTGDLIAATGAADFGPTLLQQQFSTQGAATATTSNFAAAVQPGSAVVVLYGKQNTGSAAFSGLGGTWTQVVNTQPSSNAGYEIWVAFNCTGGTTITHTNPGNFAMTCYEVFNATRVIDSSSAGGGGGSALTTGIVTATALGQFIAGGWQDFFNADGGGGSYRDTPTAWTADPPPATGNVNAHPAHTFSTGPGDYSHGDAATSGAQFAGAAVIIG